MRALKLHELSLAERLADMAVDALIDEADLSPKPALVDRRGSGAHSDLHLGLMHASALSLWPCFKEMAEAAMLILPVQRSAPDVAVVHLGSSCRICPRSTCPARREPSILTG